MREYIYAGGMLAAEYVQVTAKYYYYTTDQIRSSRVITDQSGTVVYSAQFDPYGGIIFESNTGYAPKLKFSGKEREKESKLVYFGARYYDKKSFRFLSVDPVMDRSNIYFHGSETTKAMQFTSSIKNGKDQNDSKQKIMNRGFSDPQSWNLYSFCRNSPILNYDPDGRDFLEAISNFSAAFGDTISFGLTRIARNQLAKLHGIEAVDYSSTASKIGKAGGIVVQAAISTAVVARMFGWTSKIMIHGPHHTFGPLGKLSHIQTVIWKIGEKGSQIISRLPLPWR